MYLSQTESRGYQKEMTKFHNKLLKNLMLNIPFNFCSPCSKPKVVYGYWNRETVETWRVHHWQKQWNSGLCTYTHILNFQTECTLVYTVLKGTCNRTVIFSHSFLLWHILCDIAKEKKNIHIHKHFLPFDFLNL